MKRYKDLGDKEKKDLEGELDSRAILIGHDSWESHNPTFSKSKLENLLGICASCTHLEYCGTEFGRTYAKCGFLDIRLFGNDRMIECTRLSPRGQMSISDMKEIATYIDVEREKDTGFVTKRKRRTKDEK